MATKEQLIQFLVNNRTNCSYDLPLFQSNVYSINATKQYLWNITGQNLACGTGSIYINGVLYSLRYKPNLQGLLDALNDLGFGFFCFIVLEGDTYVYTTDDVNIYGQLDLCFLFPTTTTTSTSTTSTSTTLPPTTTTTTTILPTTTTTTTILPTTTTTTTILPTTTTTTTILPTTTTTTTILPTTTSTTTTTTTLLPTIQLGSPQCRLNACNDNLLCSVLYSILTTNAPLGAYITVVTNPPASGAGVSIYNNSATAGVLQYTEPNAAQSAVFFTLQLRNSSGTVIATASTSLSHQSFWAILPVCGTTTTTTSTSTTSTTTTLIPPPPTSTTTTTTILPTTTTTTTILPTTTTTTTILPTTTTTTSTTTTTTTQGGGLVYINGTGLQGLQITNADFWDSGTGNTISLLPVSGKNFPIGNGQAGVFQPAVLNAGFGTLRLFSSVTQAVTWQINTNGVGNGPFTSIFDSSYFFTGWGQAYPTPASNNYVNVVLYQSTTTTTSSTTTTTTLPPTTSTTTTTTTAAPTTTTTTTLSPNCFLYKNLTGNIWLGDFQTCGGIWYYGVSLLPNQQICALEATPSPATLTKGAGCGLTTTTTSTTTTTTTAAPTTTTTTTVLPTTTTTTTTSTTTTTTTLAPSISLGTPSCRFDACNDNAPCQVLYNIVTANAPLGSYITVTINPPPSGATVYVFNNNPNNGLLSYYEPNAAQSSVYFTLELRNSSGTIIASSASILNHQTFWTFLPVCPSEPTITTTTTSTTTTTTTAAPFIIEIQNSIGQVLNNFTVALNGINVPNLTNISLQTAPNRLGNANSGNPVVGNNALVVTDNVTSAKMTILFSDITDRVTGIPLTFSRTAVPANTITMNPITFTAGNIANGIKIILS